MRKGLVGAIAGLGLAGALFFTQPWRMKEPGRVVLNDSEKNPVLIEMYDGIQTKRRLSEHALKKLESIYEVPRDMALEYNSRFLVEPSPIENIYRLYRNGITPEEADKYASRFDVHDILTIKSASIDWLTPLEASVFDRRYGAEEIKKFARNGIRADVANAYSDRFKFTSGGFIIELYSSGATPEIANAYNFDAWDVLKLRKAGISSDEANRYAEFEDIESQAKKSFLEKAVEE